MALIARLPLRPRLVLYRVVLLGICALLPALGAFAGLSSGVARNPLATAHAQGLPFVETLRLLVGISPIFWAAAALGILLAIRFDLRLTAGALVALDDAAADRPVPTTLGAVMRAGTPHRGAFLRTLLFTSTLAGAGIGGISALFHRLDLAATHAHRTAYHHVVVLGGLRVLSMLVVVALAGAFGLAARALIVAGARRFTVRALFIAVRASLRRPLAGPLLFVVASVLVAVGGACVLALPRIARPPAGAVPLRALLVLAVIAAQSVTWLFLVERMRAFWSHPRLAALRGSPDVPFQLWTRLRRRLRFRRAAASATVLALLLAAPAARADSASSRDPSLHPQTMLPLPPVSGSPEAVKLFRRGQRRQAFASVMFFTGLALAVNGAAFLGTVPGDNRFLDACVADRPECRYAREQQRLHLAVGVATAAIGAVAVGFGLTYFVLGGRDVRGAKKMGLQIWVRPEIGPAGPSGAELQLALGF